MTERVLSPVKSFCEILENILKEATVGESEDVFKLKMHKAALDAKYGQNMISLGKHV